MNLNKTTPVNYFEYFFVIPANAGIQKFFELKSLDSGLRYATPGMTK